jgi:DNA-directed RNA polymerase subunit RPC12/RpoP
MEGKVLLARCVNCRSEVTVPERYAHGDHIKCGTCGTQHKVLRGDVLRLVIADAAPLKDALRENERLIERLEDELRGARRSVGIGGNGLGIGVAYAVWQVALQEQSLDQGLLIRTLIVAVLSGVGLEAANLLFFAKRQRIRRLSAEIDEARGDSRAIQQKIREATRL